MKLEAKEIKETAPVKKQPNGLRVYDDTITITVSIDAIAKKFFNIINKSNPHAVLITEAVIGTAIQHGTLDTLYNALNGFTGDIDFAIGDFVFSTKKVYAYKKGVQDPVWVRGDVEIGVGQIVDIDLYRDQKVLLKYYIPDVQGELKVQQSWINHTTFTEPTEEQMKSAGLFKSQEEAEQN